MGRKQPSWREIVALPFYLVGAILYTLTAGALIVADKIADKRHGWRLLFR